MPTYRAGNDAVILIVWGVVAVLCDESRHTKFRFSYLANVTQLTPAQARFRLSSVPAQELLRFAHLC